MSSSVVESREPRAEDLAYLAQHLREQDVAELRAAGLEDVRQALDDSVARSKWARVALVDRVPAAIFGLAEHGAVLAPIGVPWMLGTDAVARHACSLQRAARAYIRAMLRDYQTLANTVHARNTVAVRWLRRLGFDLGQPFAVESGEMFQLFVMRRGEPCVSL